MFVSAIASVVQTLAAAEGVTNVQNPLVEPGGGGQISRDGHSVLVQFTIKGDPDKAKDKVAPIMDAVAGIQAAYPAFTIEEVGSRERELRARQELQQGLRERRAADDPDHAR